MRIKRTELFGDVHALEVGWSPVGTPLMTVYLFLVDNILIDTGLAHMGREIADWISGFRVDACLLTHHHEDHSGNAAIVQNRLNVPVSAPSLALDKLSRNFRILPYQHLMWGKAKPLVASSIDKEINSENMRLIPVHTPGHSKDHTSYFDPENGRLFSGDLYLADKIKYFRKDEDILQQIRSLRKALTLDFDALFCAHKPRPRDGKSHLRAKLQFLEDLYGRVAEEWEKGLDAKEIINKLGFKEVRSIKWLTLGNVSLQNIVASVIYNCKNGAKP